LRDNERIVRGSGRVLDRPCSVAFRMALYDETVGEGWLQVQRLARRTAWQRLAAWDLESEESMAS
jgi:hypothetical protein